MLRKFFTSLLLAAVVLCGCSRGRQNTDVPEGASAIAASLVEKLNLEESLELMKPRIVKGMLFSSDDIVKDSCVYKASEEGDANIVGVFVTEDAKLCLEYLNEWLRDEKYSMQTKYPSQVFKLSNAILLSNKSMVIMLVCEDIETAREEAQRILDEDEKRQED